MKVEMIRKVTQQSVAFLYALQSSFHQFIYALSIHNKCIKINNSLIIKQINFLKKERRGQCVTERSN